MMALSCWYCFLLIPSIGNAFTIPLTTTTTITSIHRPAVLNDEQVGVDDLTTTPSQTKGLYRDFVDYAWPQLLKSRPQHHDLSPVPIPSELGYNEVVAPGPNNHNNTVRITIKAAAATTTPNSTNNPAGSIQYARYALIETIPTSSWTSMPEDDTTAVSSPTARIHTDGIQVLNMVIIPFKHTGLPVFGADFVALPGHKHLLLLDAQPVRGVGTESESDGSYYDDWFQSWYERNDINGQFDWGGDLPEPVQQYVSKYALWTRFAGTAPGNATGTTTTTGDSDSTATHNRTNPIDIIQGPVMDVFIDHFQTYLQLLDHYESSSSNEEFTRRLDSANNTSRLLDYLTYRLDNDPARPMLKRLFGAEWTEQALHDILFPIHLF